MMNLLILFFGINIIAMSGYFIPQVPEGYESDWEPGADYAFPTDGTIEEKMAIAPRYGL